MLNIFRVPEPIAKLLGTNRAHSLRVLLSFSIIYFCLDSLGALAAPPSTPYDYPFLTIFWITGIWLVVVPIGRRIHRQPDGKNLALKNIGNWFLASLFGLSLAVVLIFAIYGQAPEEYFVYAFPRIATTCFVNLGVYLIILSGFFEYRETARRLRHELTRLELVRETIAGHLSGLKERYLTEIQAKISPVLSELQKALDQADPEALMGSVRSAINDVVLPLSSKIADGAFHEAMQELPELPKRKLGLRLRQVSNVKVDLEQTSMPFVILVIYLASIAPSFTFFYAGQGLASASLVLAVLMIGQVLLLRVLRNKSLSIIPTLAVIFVSSTAIASLAYLAIPLVVTKPNPEANAFLAFGIWLVFLLNALLQAANSLASNYLGKLSGVQDEFAKSLQKRDLEIRQMQNRITTAVHNDVQGKLRAILLRVRSGGLSKPNLAALESDLAHVRKALNDIEVNPTVDFFSQFRALQEFWAGVCQITISNEIAAVDIIEADNRIARRAFDVISEATANAVKHAEAELVEVNLSIKGNQLLIKVKNSLKKDLTSNPASGLGSRIFDEISDGWLASHDESQYELTVLLDLY